MPTCPGCERTVPYDRLDVHQRYCDGIWKPKGMGTRSDAGREHRLVTLEKLEQRVHDLEERLDESIGEIEARWGERRRTTRE